jgi:hypothetical protein
MNKVSEQAQSHVPRLRIPFAIVDGEGGGVEAEVRRPLEVHPAQLEA